MPKKPIDKTRVNISLDRELNHILNKKNVNKSALINALLYKYLTLEQNKTLNTKPFSRVSKECQFRDLNSGPPDYENLENGEERTREERFLNIDLKSVYKTHKNDFIEWLYSKYCNQYSNDVYNTLEKIFDNSRTTFKEIKEFIKSTNTIALKSSTISMRVFFNYLLLQELLNKEIITFYKDYIKLPKNNSFDTYNINKKEVIKLLEYIKVNHSQYEFYIRFLVESGSRITELEHFIKHFKERNIEEWNDEIIIYSNFYMRGHKASYYLFMTKSTYELFDKNKCSIKDIENLKNIIHYRELLNLKYLRKYNFTLMIENNISFEIANFIQGRASQSVGFNHYLAKKTIAVREYQKVIKLFY